MSVNHLSLLRPNSRRVYVVLCPSSSFAIKYNCQKEDKRIEGKLYAGRLEATHADVRFTTHTIRQLVNEVETRELLVHHWRDLSIGLFGSLWLYGDTPSEFVMSVLRIALLQKMHIKNYAIKGSILDRYLHRWFRCVRDA